MKFLLMMGMKAQPSEPGQGIGSWPQEDIRAHIAFMHAFNAELKAAGEYVAAEGLAWPAEARVVRAGEGGEPVISSDFEPSKEFLMGFWIVHVQGAERAFELAARVSAAPGRGGRPLNMPIEVRQIPSGPPA